jgi:ATP-binding cassette subfamily B protein
MTAERLTQLRRDTAWVEPGVQLWNRSLLDNLQYGAASTAAAMASVMEQCGLREVIERLPEGLLSHLGEGGALVSGGEGQRIRLARAMLRGTVRLVILDEPFRGLDREDRRMLLFRARAHWQHASLMVVTHDIEDTLDFDRVVVMDQGRVIEQGEPRLLVRQSGSRYCQLLEAEDAVRSRLWNGPSWRHLRMRQGKIIQQPREVSVL